FRIVEIGRNGNYRFSNFLSQEIFRSRLHFLKDHGGELLGSIRTIAYLDSYSVVGSLLNFVRSLLFLIRNLREFLSHKSFDRRNSIGGVGYRLSFGRIPNLSLTISIVQKRNNRRGCSSSFAVLNYHWLITFHYRNA